jgi:uncharacterized lipoprotein YmbA
MCVLAAACATSALERYYTLAPYGPDAGVAHAPAALRIEVGAVSVPESADRAELVVVRDGTTLTLFEQERWAEPLRVGIGRVLALDLARQSSGSLVWAFPATGLPDPDYHVTVDVQRLEADGTHLRLEAIWSVRPLRSPATGAAKPAAQSGHSFVDQAMSGSGPASLVEAHGRAVAALAADIAKALPRPPGQ